MAMSSTRAILAVLLLTSCSTEVPEPTGKTKELGAASTALKIFVSFRPLGCHVGHVRVLGVGRG